MSPSNLSWTLSCGAPPIGWRIANWWTTEAWRLDGVVPGFVADVVGGRHMLAGAPATLTALFANANTTSVATRIDAGGTLRLAASGELRLDHRNGFPELLLEGQTTNKVTCRKHNPTDTTNLTLSGDAAAVLAVVDDAAALAAAGLAGLCTNAKVYRLDNSAGTASAQAIAAGSVGNTNPHTIAAYLRGTGAFQVDLDQGVPTTVACPAGYALCTTDAVVPLATTARFRLTAAAGAVVFFVLPQLVEAAQIASVVPGDTLAAVTRTADLVTLSTTAAAVLQGAGAALAWRGEVPVGIAVGQLMGVASGLGLLREGGGSFYPNLALQGAAAGLTVGFSVIPGILGVCVGWGPSGRRGTVGGEVAAEDTVTMTYAFTSVHVGPSGGLVAGQILRLRQLVAWAIADRPSAAGVQSQARISA